MTEGFEVGDALISDAFDRLNLAAILRRSSDRRRRASAPGSSLLEDSVAEIIVSSDCIDCVTDPAGREGPEATGT